MGENRMLVCGTCQAGSANRARIKARSHAPTIRKSDPGESRRRPSKLDQCFSWGNDLRGRRHGSYSGTEFDHRRNSATVRHDLSAVRLRPSGRVESQVRIVVSDGEYKVDKQGSAVGYTGERISI